MQIPEITGFLLMRVFGYWEPEHLGEIYLRNMASLTPFIADTSVGVMNGIGSTYWQNWLMSQIWNGWWLMARVAKSIPTLQERLGGIRIWNAQKGAQYQNYKVRHLAENAFLKLKRWRGVATRYAKTTVAFVGAVQCCAILQWLRIDSWFCVDTI